MRVGGMHTSSEGEARGASCRAVNACRGKYPGVASVSRLQGRQWHLRQRGRAELQRAQAVFSQQLSQESPGAAPGRSEEKTAWAC